MPKPLAIDLFSGLGGWTGGLIAEGFRVVGFDIERHVYAGHPPYPAQLVLQDVLTIHGSQFKDAAIIVASPPCQEFSYMAMPWSRGKQILAALEGRGDFPKGYKGSRTKTELTALFDACFRIQRESSAAAGRHIPMVVENVRGAQRWVGKAKWNHGSFFLWGDVPALMPILPKRVKVPGFRFDGSGGSFQTASVAHTKTIAHVNQREHDAARGIKQGGDWFNSSQPSISRLTGSKSPARKAASAMIAMIPPELSRHIARFYHPERDR